MRVFNKIPLQDNQKIYILTLIIGGICGLAAVSFHLLLDFFQDHIIYAAAGSPHWWRIPAPIIIPSVGGLLLGLIGAMSLFLTGSSSIFGVGYQQLSGQLQSSRPLKILIVLGIFKLAATVISYSSGSAGGIFGPSLYVGGMIGGAVGVLTKLVLGEPQIQPEAFALVGMGAVFAGIVRAPVTSIIIIFEMTNNYAIILPLMIANITSYVVAYELSPTPIYDALLTQDGVNLPHTQRQLLRQVPVSAVMTKEVIAVRDHLSVDEAFQNVESNPAPHHAYPVVDGTGRLVGLFTLNDLKRAMADDRGNHRLTEVVSHNLVHAYPDQTLEAAMILLGQRGLTQLPVVSRKNHSRLLGIITLHDIAEVLSREGEFSGSAPMVHEQQTS
ncbi:MAG TPA: chloride channel protein [Blastocatellia bacterium]|nr:chloride channel protein [Blastocatellia bacterium]